MRDAFGVDREVIHKGIPSTLRPFQLHPQKFSWQKKPPSLKKFKRAWKKNAGMSSVPKNEELSRKDVKLIKPMLKTIRQMSGDKAAYVSARKARHDFGRDASIRIARARNLYQQDHAQTYVKAGKKAKEFEAKISKIAMQPVYHGTTKGAAKALMRGSKWSPKGKKHIPEEHPRFVFTASQDRSFIANQFGTMRTARSKKAKPGVIRDQPANPDNARVLTYNAVGVKPIRTSDMERVYDAKELGRPLASSRIPSQKKLTETSRKVDELTGTKPLDHPEGVPAADLRTVHSKEFVKGRVDSMPRQLPKAAQKGLRRRAKRDIRTWGERQR